MDGEDSVLHHLGSIIKTKSDQIDSRVRGFRIGTQSRLFCTFFLYSFLWVPVLSRLGDRACVFFAPFFFLIDCLRFCRPLPACVSFICFVSVFYFHVLIDFILCCVYISVI